MSGQLTEQDIHQLVQHAVALKADRKQIPLATLVTQVLKEANKCLTTKAQAHVEPPKAGPAREVHGYSTKKKYIHVLRGPSDFTEECADLQSRNQDATSVWVYIRELRGVYEVNRSFIREAK